MVVRELIVEIGDLRARVKSLEQQLDNGRTEPGVPPAEPPRAYKLALMGESYEHLGGLYREGFHICPVAYGEPREGECLFCSAFLSRE